MNRDKTYQKASSFTFRSSSTIRVFVRSGKSIGSDTYRHRKSVDPVLTWKTKAASKPLVRSVTLAAIDNNGLPVYHSGFNVASQRFYLQSAQHLMTLPCSSIISAVVQQVDRSGIIDSLVIALITIRIGLRNCRSDSGRLVSHCKASSIRPRMIARTYVRHSVTVELITILEPAASTHARHATCDKPNIKNQFTRRKLVISVCLRSNNQRI